MTARARLPEMPRRAAGARPGPRAVGAGVRYIGGNTVLVGAFLADVNATIFGLPVALFPAINAERFGGDPRTLGLFTAPGMVPGNAFRPDILAGSATETARRCQTTQV